MNGDFIDTNVFIYLFDERDEKKRQTARELVLGALASGQGCISAQVVQETLNVLMRKAPAPMSPEDARQVLEDVLAPLWTVQSTEALYHRALDVRSRYRFGFYDSLIVAAALEAGSTRLYSEDFQDGQRIESMRVVNPFRA